MRAWPRRIFWHKKTTLQQKNQEYNGQVRLQQNNQNCVGLVILVNCTYITLAISYICEGRTSQCLRFKALHTVTMIELTLFPFHFYGFLTSSSATKPSRKWASRLMSDIFTCCHTRDREGRPWLLSQPVTLY